MLEWYETIIVEDIQYVRKQIYDELKKRFEEMCQAHNEFVSKVHGGLLAKKTPIQLPELETLCSTCKDRGWVPVCPACLGTKFLPTEAGKQILTLISHENQRTQLLIKANQLPK